MSPILQNRPSLRMRVSANELFLLCGLWLLLFLEPINLGGVKLSHLWKVTFIAFLTLAVLRPKMPLWFIFGIAYAVKYLVYTRIPYGLMENLQNATESLLFPLFMAFMYQRFYSVPDFEGRLIRFSVVMSFFFIYSAVPSLLGIKSLNPATDLLMYGLEESATKGLFYHIAVASQMYTFATLVIMAAYPLFKLSVPERIIYFGTVLLGVFLIYGTFARTAWFAFIIVGFVLFFLGKGIKRKVVGALMAAVLITGALWVYETNEAVQLRMKGGATYRQDVELSVDGLLRSRLPFIFIAMDNLADAGPAAVLIGYGTQQGKDLFDEKTGMAIVSHNKTMEIVESSGVLGLVIYIGFVFNVFVVVRRGYWRSDPVVRNLTLVCGLLFAFFYLVSHGLPLWCEVVISGVLVANMLRARSPATTSSRVVPRRV